MTRITDLATAHTLAREILAEILPQTLGLTGDASDDAPTYTLDICWAYNRKRCRQYAPITPLESAPSYDGDGTRVAVTLTVEHQRESPWDTEAPIFHSRPLNEDPVRITLEFDATSTMGQRLIDYGTAKVRAEANDQKALLDHQIAELQARRDLLDSPSKAEASSSTVTNKYGTTIEPGQVWADNDSRSAGRTVKVREIADGSAICTVLTACGGGKPKRREVTIAIDRLHPTSKGYRLVPNG